MSSKRTRIKLINVLDEYHKNLPHDELAAVAMNTALQLALRMTDEDIKKWTAFVERESGKVTA
jgi:hypothetical protein